MKLKFKKQEYQTESVNAIAECFTGQPVSSGIQYRIDPGKSDKLNYHKRFWLELICDGQEIDLEMVKFKGRQNSLFLHYF